VVMNPSALGLGMGNEKIGLLIGVAIHRLTLLLYISLRRNYFDFPRESVESSTLSSLSVPRI
jgi:hypothetical protein